MAWTAHPKVHRDPRPATGCVDVVVETLDGFRRHLTGRNGAVLAYYGFLTLFPLLMAATTILGFVLDGNPELAGRIVDSALSQIPVHRRRTADRFHHRRQLVGARRRSGGRDRGGRCRRSSGIQVALDDTWEIAVDDRAEFVTLQRARR